MPGLGTAAAAAAAAKVTSPVVAEEVEKEKRKKRRSNRRHNKNVGSFSGGGFVPADGVSGEALHLLSNGDRSTANSLCQKGFKSLPTMHVSGDGGILGNPPCVGLHDGGILGNPPPCVLSPEVMKVSSSCSSCPSSSSPNTSGRRYFMKYWSELAVEAAIKEGRAFTATFRVNAHNRLQAYCSVDGLAVDVLISGAAAQNRAIEGDVVAIKLDLVDRWTRLKGMAVSGNPSSLEDSDTICEVGDSAAFRCMEETNLSDNGDFPTYLPGSNCLSFDANVGRENGSVMYSPNDGCASQPDEAARNLGRICSMLSSHPTKRPTGKVISILKASPRRGAVVGFLAVNQWLSKGRNYRKTSNGQNSFENMNHMPGMEYLELLPTDPKLPKMVVNLDSLPGCVKQKLFNGDNTVGKELVAARVESWGDDCEIPQAHIIHVLGRGGEIEPQIAAILFENGICRAEFSPEALTCLPDSTWKVPPKEINSRRDLRNVCTFTIDPPSAMDLDDALSIEVVSDEVFRVGVHIADANYFIIPGSALDSEAQARSTSSFVLQHKIPMLPPIISQDLGSLVPGADRLALSIIWDIDLAGNIIDRWIGRSIICSACKLSYELVQDIVDGSLDAIRIESFETLLPSLHGQFEWKDVISSLRKLQEVCLRLKEIRVREGALSLRNTELNFLFDDDGTPFDVSLQDMNGHCSIVEEYMLLANRSVAEVISKFFPDCALLRRHSEPNSSKLKEFKAFCRKHGFDLDVSSSYQLHLSLSKIKESLSDDRVLFDILVSYASKTMKSATYFCSGTLSNMEHEWVHYALSIPMYAHFTSPLRRYPDIIVHRTLLAVLDAEQRYQNQSSSFLGESRGEEFRKINFTGLNFCKDAVDFDDIRDLLNTSAQRFNIPNREMLENIALYCNERKLSSKRAEDASEKLYLWTLLKKKGFYISEARVLGLGPSFMTFYIDRLGMEQRIYYDDVEGLAIDWLETTSTVVLDLLETRPKRGFPGKLRSVDDVVLLVHPSDIFVPEEDDGAISTPELAACAEVGRIDPPVFPLMLKLLSCVPVTLHAVGGEDAPLGIGARLCMSSYRVDSGH